MSACGWGKGRTPPLDSLPQRIRILQVNLNDSLVTDNTRRNTSGGNLPKNPVDVFNLRTLTCSSSTGLRPTAKTSGASGPTLTLGATTAGMSGGPRRGSTRGPCPRGDHPAGPGEGGLKSDGLHTKPRSNSTRDPGLPFFSPRKDGGLAASLGFPRPTGPITRRVVHLEFQQPCTVEARGPGERDRCHRSRLSRIRFSQHASRCGQLPPCVLLEGAGDHCWRIGRAAGAPPTAERVGPEPDPPSHACSTSLHRCVVNRHPVAARFFTFTR
jgi:hypothetical protein